VGKISHYVIAKAGKCSPFILAHALTRRRTPLPAPDTLTLMRLLALVMAAATLLAFSPQKAKKPADVEMLETKAVRDAGKISVDGRVKVTGEKALHGLVIVFDFRSPEKEVVTAQKTMIDNGTMESGSEGSFHNEMVDAPRAVKYTIRAFDAHEKELRVANPGPYVVE
jgi:hypothetical protein